MMEGQVQEDARAEHRGVADHEAPLVGSMVPISGNEAGRGWAGALRWELRGKRGYRYWTLLLSVAILLA